MKQLKFMLVAATALGLATASQADEVFKDNFDTTLTEAGKEDAIPAGTAATTLGYTYNGTGTGEDYSQVVANGGHDGNALKVDTDGTPLTRSLGSSAYDLADYESVYIDTMVKFTATPIGDTVTPTPNEDKLMIYLQATNEVTTVEGKEQTNDVNRLMVLSGHVRNPQQGRIDLQKCTINNFTVAPNKWYHLVVTAKKGQGNLPHFKIEMCDPAVSTTLTTLTAVEEPTGDFTSLIKTDAATISSVGFAGEGWIDDLAFGTVTAATSVDFTFTGDYLSSVTYTIGTDKETEYTWSGEAKVLEEADSITITSIAFSGLYKVAENSAVKVGSTHDVNAAGMKFAVTSAELTGEGETAVPAGTTASQIGITNDAFAAADNDQLNALVKWAKAANKGSLALINSMTFDANGYPSGDGQVAAEAYLLDCAPDEVETEKGKFKLSISFDENGAPVVEGPDGVATYKNGNIVLKGREKLTEGNWVDKAEGHKFFKAFLKK